MPLLTATSTLQLLPFVGRFMRDRRRVFHQLHHFCGTLWKRGKITKQTKLNISNIKNEVLVFGDYTMARGLCGRLRRTVVCKRIGPLRDPINTIHFHRGHLVAYILLEMPFCSKKTFMKKTNKQNTNCVRCQLSMILVIMVVRQRGWGESLPKHML